MDMTVDFNGKHSVFYSDNRFLRDSLSLIAFDSNGNVIDDEAYGQITRMSNKSSKDILFVDYASSKFHQSYRVLTSCMKGTGTLDTPKWEILGDGKEIEGYRTKMARATTWEGNGSSGSQMRSLPVPGLGFFSERQA